VCPLERVKTNINNFGKWSTETVESEIADKGKLCIYVLQERMQ
jgi:hypothetical protein